jgi:endonuclease/exonuclease/phosphatase (EEP) superfamily protein YafD
MAYNVGNGLANPERLASGLHGARADIVGLVEVTVAQAAAIRRDLAEEHPFQVHQGDGIPGKALVSRFPIETSLPLELHPGRPDLVALVDVGGRCLRVMVAHPPPPRLHRSGLRFTDETREQFAELLKLATAGGPTILLGDFNMLDRDDHHSRLVAAGFVDSFREAGTGNGFTYPRRVGKLSLLPVARIDYVWHSAHLRAVDAWVGDDAGSDHLPVLVELAWNAAAEPAVARNGANQDAR